MFDERALESAETGKALSVDKVTETQIEVFFLRRGSYKMPVLHREHDHGSARCGFVEIGDSCLCVFVFRIDDEAIVRSADKIGLMDFITLRDRAEGRLVAGQQQFFNENFALFKSAMEQN